MKHADNPNTPPELIFFRKEIAAGRRIPLFLMWGALISALIFVCSLTAWNPVFMIFILPIFAAKLLLIPWAWLGGLSWIAAMILADAGRGALLKEPAQVSTFKRLTHISFACDAVTAVCLIGTAGWLLKYSIM